VDGVNTHADVRVYMWRRAGRDQLVYATDLKTFESSCMLRSRDAVLKMLLSPDKGLWLSMTNSDIEYWDVEPVLQVPRMHPSRAPPPRLRRRAPKHRSKRAYHAKQRAPLRARPWSQWAGCVVLAVLRAEGCITQQVLTGRA
jgi:hypothetical protein